MRANCVFRADEKRIRTENTVMDKNKDSAGVLYEIADWVRMCFSSVPNRRSARTASRPRNIATMQKESQLSISAQMFCAQAQPYTPSVSLAAADNPPEPGTVLKVLSLAS